jgi:hypothetical protein
MPRAACYCCAERGEHRLTTCIGAAFPAAVRTALAETGKSRGDTFSCEEKDAIDAKVQSATATCDRSFHQGCLGREHSLAFAATRWTKNANTGLYALMPMT